VVTFFASFSLNYLLIRTFSNSSSRFASSASCSILFYALYEFTKNSSLTNFLTSSTTFYKASVSVYLSLAKSNIKSPIGIIKVPIKG